MNTMFGEDARAERVKRVKWAKKARALNRRGKKSRSLRRSSAVLVRSMVWGSLHGGQQSVQQKIEVLRGMRSVASGHNVQPADSRAGRDLHKQAKRTKSLWCGFALREVEPGRTSNAPRSRKKKGT